VRSLAHGVPMIDNRRLYSLIGQRVRRIREMQNPRMSQEELARILELKRTSITNVERGNQKLTLGALYRLCERFGLEIAELVPRVSDVSLAEAQSIIIGGKSHEVGIKTAGIVARLRPAQSDRVARSGTKGEYAKTIRKAD
jgi:transcriptional regulator with XRE-family HTH domain